MPSIDSRSLSKHEIKRIRKGSQVPGLLESNSLTAQLSGTRYQTTQDKTSPPPARQSIQFHSSQVNPLVSPMIPRPNSRGYASVSNMCTPPFHSLLVAAAPVFRWRPKPGQGAARPNHSFPVPAGTPLVPPRGPFINQSLGGRFVVSDDPGQVKQPVDNPVSYSSCPVNPAV